MIGKVLMGRFFTPLDNPKIFFIPSADVNQQSSCDSFDASHTTQQSKPTLWGNPLIQKLLRNNQNAVKICLNPRPVLGDLQCLTDMCYMHWVGLLLLIGCLFCEL